MQVVVDLGDSGQIHLFRSASINKRKWKRTAAARLLTSQSSRQVNSRSSRPCRMRSILKSTTSGIFAPSAIISKCIERFEAS